MERNALATKTGQNSSLRAIRWAVAVERQRLSAAIGDAIREVMKAERLLAADVDEDAARSLAAWTAILESRTTRLQSFELRNRSLKLAACAEPRTALGEHDKGDSRDIVLQSG
jgi:hypothetical protein